MLGTILLIFLLIVLLGGVAPWGNYAGPNHGYGYGPAVPGGLGLILVIVSVLVLLGRF